MNIAQVFYLARCASKTPEEREQINKTEELLDKFMTSAQAMVKAAHAPDRHDVGSAPLILSLHHNAEAAQAIEHVLTSYWHAGGVTRTGRDLLSNKGAPAVKVKHITDNRPSWEHACRTATSWEEFIKFGYKVENITRIDVLKAVAASYRAEHAEVPEWIEEESLAVIHTTLQAVRATKPRKKRK